MKMAFLAVTLLGLLVLVHGVHAQAYGPYYVRYDGATQYQQIAQQSNPYYELEVIHYQLYLPQHQPYPTYPLYQPCCFVGGVVVPGSLTVISPWPRVIFSPRVRR
jgi:hypothetical protein